MWKNILIALLVTLFVVAMIDWIFSFIEFPEKYLSTWRYQLHEEVKSGDKQAVDYYQKHYLDKGVRLWE